MVRVTARRKSGQLVYLKLFGHSGFAENGYDIVCAAVSAIAQTAAIGIEAYKGNARVVMDESLPLIEIELLDFENQEALAILNTAYLGLADIAKGMPEHISIIHE